LAQVRDGPDGTESAVFEGANPVGPDRDSAAKSEQATANTAKERQTMHRLAAKNLIARAWVFRDAGKQLVRLRIGQSDYLMTGPEAIDLAAQLVTAAGQLDGAHPAATP
jgi:hypothetical protein